MVAGIARPARAQKSQSGPTLSSGGRAKWRPPTDTSASTAGHRGATLNTLSFGRYSVVGCKKPLKMPATGVTGRTWEPTPACASQAVYRKKDNLGCLSRAGVAKGSGRAGL
jgi:hypothetical protein